MSAAEAPSPRGSLLVGRPFVGAWFDLLAIGGLLSLVVIAIVLALRSGGAGRMAPEISVSLLLLTTSTHFAASTVRLYSKPGSFQTLPVMTMLFPLIAFAAAGVGLWQPDLIGRPLYVLYLSWSPYHYAAQTFGLTSMYAARAGMPMIEGQRRLLWWTCMLPFAHSFVSTARTGLGWFLPPSFFTAHPELLELRWGLSAVLGVAVFVAPLLLFFSARKKNGRSLPLIVGCLLVSNGVWWVVLPYEYAFFWATVFHSVQYIAIVIVFHLRDHPPTGSGRFAWVGPSFKFYAACLALAWLLFDVWPYFYTWLGFSFAESMLICVAVINIHHFVVDRGIWQIRKDRGNQQAASA